MKFKKTIEIEITKIHLDLPVRYEDEDIPYDFPCRVKCTDKHYGDHDRLILMVDINTGEILTPEFPKDFSYDIIDMKVCDQGIYTLYDSLDNVIAKHDCYVLECVPGEYGDYVQLHIKDGFITNWTTPNNFDEFEEQE